MGHLKEQAIRENTRVECPVCSIVFVVATDTKETECPNCGFVFELTA